MVTITETIRHCGPCGDTGEGVPHKLTEFQDWLAKAVLEIPPKYLGTAEIDFEPDYEFGEYYAAVRITYERQEAPEETATRITKEREHWSGQLEQARERVALCEQQLAAHCTEAT